MKKKQAVLILAAVFATLFDKCIFIVPSNHPLLNGFSNELYELRDTHKLKALGLVGNNMVLINGQEVEVHKFMLVSESWIKTNFLDPFSAEKWRLNDDPPQQQQQRQPQQQRSQQPRPVTTSYYSYAQTRKMHKAAFVAFAVSFILLSIGMGSPYWETYTGLAITPGHDGLWQTCSGTGLANCYQIDNNPNTCNNNATFTDSDAVKACQEIYAAKGFSILAILFLVLASFFAWLTKDGGCKLKIGYLCAFISVGSGLIASGAYADQLRYNNSNVCGSLCTIDYGWAFGVFSAGWILEFFALMIWCCKRNSSTSL